MLGNPSALIKAMALLGVGAFVAGCGGGGDGGSPREGSSPVAEEAALLPLAGRATFYGAQAGDNAGSIIAGDFNGDGETDIVLAASLADGPDDSRGDSGEAYLFLGPFSPGDALDPGKGEQDATFYGAGRADQMGRALAAGDLNGDGTDDLVLSAPLADGRGDGRPDSGEIYVVFGSAGLGGETKVIDLADGAGDVTVLGADDEDLAGFTLAVADLNGDDLGDLIAGALWGDGPGGERVNAGEIYVVFGAVDIGGTIDLAAGEQDAVVYGDSLGAELGQALAVGDLDGDGLPDLVMAASAASGAADQEMAGRVYVVSSPPPAVLDLAQGDAALTVYGDEAEGELGHALAAGDVNGDGRDDLLLTAPGAEVEGEEDAVGPSGKAALLLGGVDLPEALDLASGGAAMLVYGADGGDNLGRSAAVGDIDGDGLADVLLAALAVAGRSGPSISGEVYALFGSEGFEEVTRLPDGARVIGGLDEGDLMGNETFGSPSLLAADIDLDRRYEIVVVAPWADGPDNARMDSGEAYILFPSR